MEQQSYNQEWIVRYLLNDLPKEEQLRFEDEYFADHDLFEQMEAIEEDLIEDYFRNRLTATEHAKFERHYLATPERREKIAFGEALVSVASELTKPTPDPSPPSSWWSWLLPKPAVGWAFATLLLLAACTWLFVETRKLRSMINQIQVQTAVREQQQQRHAQELQQQAAAQRERSDQLTRELAEAQTQIAQLRAGNSNPAQAPSLLATIVFLPPTQGTAPAQDLVIRPGISFVQLVCRFYSDVFKSYRAVLRPTGGDAVWDQSGLKLKTQASGSKAVVVSLPAYLFTKTESYTLMLSGVASDGGFREIVYNFRVVRQ